MVKTSTIILTAILLAGLLTAQWLTVLAVLPHARLPDCTQHQCGCATAMTARKACCCYHPESLPQTVGATLLQSARCGGEAAPATMTLVKLDWTVPVIESVIRVAGPSNNGADWVESFSVRIVEPAVPPPKSPLCFV